MRGEARLRLVHIVWAGLHPHNLAYVATSLEERPHSLRSQGSFDNPVELLVIMHGMCLFIIHLLGQISTVTDLQLW